jgi:hypothetical protein
MKAKLATTDREGVDVHGNDNVVVHGSADSWVRLVRVSLMIAISVILFLLIVMVKSLMLMMSLVSVLS